MTLSGKSIFNVKTDYNDIKKMEQYLNKTYWPYQYKIEMPLWARDSHTIEVDRWCYKNFKSRNWRSMYGTYAFKRKEDFEWFLLRWA
jgi:hypothetical protein